MASHSSISAIAMSMASMMPVDPSAIIANKVRVVVVQRDDEGLCCLCLAAQGVCNGVSAHRVPFDGVEVFSPRIRMDVSARAHVSRQHLPFGQSAPGRAVQPVVANLRPPLS